MESEDFDIVLGVTPRDDDTTAAYAQAAGITILQQPIAVGLTDLWNRLVAYGLREGYDYIFIINNDILISEGTISTLLSSLQANKEVALALPTTRHGAGSIVPEKIGKTCSLVAVPLFDLQTSCLPGQIRTKKWTILFPSP